MLLRLGVAVLLELTDHEVAKPVEMPRLCTSSACVCALVAVSTSPDACNSWNMQRYRNMFTQPLQLSRDAAELYERWATSMCR